MNFIIPFYIYPGVLMVSIDENLNSYKKNLLKAGICNDSLEKVRELETLGSATWYYGNRKPRVYSIRLQSYPRDPLSISTLVHELVHIAQFLLQDRLGMELTGESSEAYCYFIDYLTKEVLEELRKRKKFTMKR